MCCFFVVAALALSFFMYAYAMQKKQCFRIMQNYNRNIVTNIKESFDVIDESAKKQGIRIVGLPSTTSLIYGDDYSQNQHALDMNRLTREINTIPYVESVITYNSKTAVFKYYQTSERRCRQITDNILHNGKSFYPYAPYMSIVRGTDGNDEAVITYYCYEYLKGDTMNGVMVINISTEWIENILKSIEDTGINVMLCRSDGTIVYSYKSLSEEETGQYAKKIAEGTKNAGFSASLNGRKSYLTVDEMWAGDCYIVCKQDYSVIYKAYMRQSGMYLTMLLAAIFILGLVVSKMLSDYISRPINKLSAYISGGMRMTDDVFDEIYTILKQNTSNTVQISEMKKAIGLYREQNHIIALLNDGKAALSDAEYSEIENYFGGGRLIGVELLLERNIDFERIRYICADFVRDRYIYKIAALGHNDYIMVVKCGEENDFYTDISKLKNVIESESGQQVSVFISGGYKADELEKMYGELKYLCEYELIYSRGCIIDKSIVEENLSADKYYYPIKEEAGILKAISDRDVRGAELLFDNFLSEIIGCRVDDFRASILKLVIDIQAMFENCDRGAYDRIADLIRTIPTVKSMNEVCEKFCELVKICCSESETKESYSEDIRCMIEFIEENYSNHLLNADMTADRLQLSAAYCNKKFKEETGVSINKYLTEYRLKMAARCLNENRESISSIMQKVGFANESNFYRQFKKYYGVTPKEYSLILQNRNDTE